jgi:hypothetical protein
MGDTKGSSNLIPYLAFASTAIVLAFAASLAVHYILTGEISMDLGNPYTWGVAALLFPIFTLLHRFFPGRSKCVVCGAWGRDYIVGREGRETPFCRDHFIEEFRKGFTGFRDRMVVLYPGLEAGEEPNYTYGYLPLRLILKKNPDNEAIGFIERSLASISGECSRCGNRPATVAYFGPGSYTWEESRSDVEGWDYPAFNNIATQPQIVCTHCIADEIVQSLRSYKDYFSDGIVLPYGGQGMLFPVAV